MAEEMGPCPYMNAITLVEPKTITRNREESVQELRKWKILQDVPEVLLHQIRYAMVACRASADDPYCYALMMAHDDQAYVIGDNRWGQLGVDKSDQYVHTAMKFKQLSGLGIIGFSASWYFASAWTNDGKLFMMGLNNEGQLGQGHQKELGLPHQVFPRSNMKVTKAACGGDHAICLTTDGSVYAWGSNNYRECIPDSVDTVTKPTQVKFPADTKKIVDIACTESTSFALTADGHLYAWGRNGDGEAGTGSAEEFAIRPTKIPFPADESVKSISCGYRHCIVLTRKGTLFVWGLNADGELGTGNQQEVAFTPTKVDLPHVAIISAVNGNSSSVCKTMDGKIYAWGEDVDSDTPKCTKFKSINDCCAHYEMGMSETWTSQYILDTIEPDCVSFLKLHSKKIPFLVEGTKISAPRIYLQRCSVFQEKLKQEWKQELQTSGVVNITGHKAKHFQIFTNFLQTDRVEDALGEDLIDLYKLAHLYKMERFRLAVIDMIREAITAENALQFYIIAVERNDKVALVKHIAIETLQWETINFFEPNAVLEFLGSTNLTTVDPKYVVQFLTDVKALGVLKP